MLRDIRRPGFTTKNSLNAPIVTHLDGEPQHISKDEILQFLQRFISEKETLGNDPALGTNDNPDLDINLSSALSQLKRVQRDFQGLPPSALEEDHEVNPDSNNGIIETKSAAGGIKKRFED